MLRFFSKLTFRGKLILAGVLTSVPPLLFVLALVWSQNQETLENATNGLERLAAESLENSARGVESTCAVSQLLLEQSASQGLSTAVHLFQRAGGMHIIRGWTQDWVARNQFTSQSTTARLDIATIAGTPLLPDAELPLLADISRLTTSSTTIFQRMNEAGDMLRVATTVTDANGKRATGTYIPARTPDGEPNPVIAQTLAGKRYVGRAQVVGRWHVTAYEPIKDIGGRVIGMLFVGLPEEAATQRIQAAILETRIGQSGFSFVVNAKGEDLGRIVFARDNQSGQRRDAAIELARKAQELPPGEGSTIPHLWQGEAHVAHVRYFAPWDWVIIATMPEKELLAAARANGQLARRGSVQLVMLTMLTAAVVCGVWWLLARRWMRRVAAVVSRIHQAAGEVSGASGHVAEVSGSTADGSSRQAAASQQVSSAIAVMARNSGDTSTRSEVLHAAATEARKSAESGAAATSKLTAAMAEMDQSSRRMRKVIEAIDEIAMQTNLLALNASVEAARAGAAGQGFAVVADAVRSLAGRCAEAAQETSTLIRGSVELGQAAALHAGETAASLGTISAAAQKLDELAAQFAASAASQTEGISELSQAMGEISRASAESASLASESAAAAGQLHVQSRSLRASAAALDSLFLGGKR